jgi:O-acetyl-ADP-ribose deacetylase (regulator of RNase III)
MDKPQNLIIKRGNLFDSTMPAIAHGVNVKAAMFSGVAAELANRYPEVEEAYNLVCERKVFIPGQMLALKGHDGKWILNLSSQNNPGADARLPWLEAALTAAFQFVNEECLEGFAMPRIGAGIGGLDWDDVESVVYQQAALNPNILVEVWVQ